jgi:hypothetical protein
MPPLVVPTTVSSGTNRGSCVITWLIAAIVMCEARCRRLLCRSCGGNSSEKPFIAHLPGRFAAASIDRKPSHRSHTIARILQRAERLGQIRPQRADHARGHDSNALIFYVSCDKCHVLGNLFGFGIPVAFSVEAPYKWLKRKPKLGMLVDCQLSLFSGDLKSDKREQ